MKHSDEKPAPLEYHGHSQRDPLAYWISPRAMFHLLWLLGLVAATTALVLPWGGKILALLAGYICVGMAIIVRQMELRK